MSNLDRFGNTSAASIPIALCEAIDQERVHEGDKLVFVGFGGGLTWAAMVVEWTGTKPKEARSGVLNKQRRQVSYFWARLRAQVRRTNRAFTEFLDRVRPKRGRIRRATRQNRPFRVREKG